MKALDLFSAAAGGWSLGLHRAGFTTIAACEVVAWRRALYAENNPGVRLYEDVRTLTAERLLADLGALPDIIVGSPPCQDISSANTKGKGVEGERSGLYFEAVRLVGECRPRWFAFENSANLRTKGADRILGEFEALGYPCEPTVVGGDDIGANHERKRSWLIGYDPTQVAYADAIRWDDQRCRGRGGLDVSVPHDPEHAAGFGHEGGRSRGYGPDGDGAPSTTGGDPSGDAKGHGRSEGRQGRRALAASRLPVEACGDGAEPAPNPDQARQAHGCLEPGLRQEEITLDGRGSRWGDDRSSAGQVGLCAPDRADPSGPRADWSLGDLTRHLQLDDGLPARVARTRVAVGGPKGTSAAALIVEAFGDAVLPQIPEAIGRAILRTEAALSAIYQHREAA